MSDRRLLTTKFGMRRGSNAERIVDTRPCVIRSSIERSLRRLQTDYVDVYLYHSPPDTGSINEGREILERLKQEGKIRFYGISTNNPEHLGQLIARNAVEVVLFSQSLLTHPSKLLESGKTHNLGIMIRGALERGPLSDKYFYCKPDFHDQDIRKHADQGTDFHKYAAYRRFLPEGVPMATFALRYLMDFETTQTIILG